MDGKQLGEILGSTFAAISHDGTLALNELSLPSDAALLDVGTGAGNFAIFLALQGYRVLTGEPSTDTSQYANIDWATNAEKAGVRDRIQFRAFDASKMPFDSMFFDAVFFFGVLHHTAPRVRNEVLREAFRVSKKNGAYVFFEPTRATLEKLWIDDPKHPLAVSPSDYLTNKDVSEIRLTGEMMDIFIYRKLA